MNRSMPTNNTNHNDKLIHARFLFTPPSASPQAFTLDVDIKIPGTGITAIFGDSGSGKTSLLRCIAGLESADKGELCVNGDIWQDAQTCLPTHKRPLGYVFQESSLFPHLTALGNLKYAMKRSGKVTSPDFYEHVIDIMGIAPILSRNPHQLSGGERQRIAIARALLIQPQLLLMDEPLASLDFARKLEILPYLERLHASFNIPILYVSHAMDEVARLADHTVVMAQGKVVAQGSLADVFSRIDLPIRFHEETGVILQGKVVERDKQWHLTRIAFSGGELWVADGDDELDQSVRVRILARDVSLALSCPDNSSVLNRLRVEVTELNDDDTAAMSLIRLKAGDEYIIARVTRKSVARLAIKTGDLLWAQIKSVAVVR